MHHYEYDRSAVQVKNDMVNIQHILQERLIAHTTSHAHTYMYIPVNLH